MRNIFWSFSSGCRGKCVCVLWNSVVNFTNILRAEFWTKVLCEASKYLSLYFFCERIPAQKLFKKNVGEINTWSKVTLSFILIRVSATFILVKLIIQNNMYYQLYCWHSCINVLEVITLIFFCCNLS